MSDWNKILQTKAYNISHYKENLIIDLANHATLSYHLLKTQVHLIR